MRTARIEMPGAIYDASAATGAFTEWKVVDFQIENGEIPKTGDGEYEGGIRSGFRQMRGFHDFFRVCVWGVDRM